MWRNQSKNWTNESAGLHGINLFRQVITSRAICHVKGFAVTPSAAAKAISVYNALNASNRRRFESLPVHLMVQAAERTLTESRARK